MFNHYRMFILLNEQNKLQKNPIELIRKPTSMEISEVTVLTDCEDFIVNRLCTVVEEAVLGILLREGILDFDSL